MTKRLPNILAFPGVGLTAYGLWLVHPALACIGVGAILVFLGVWLHLNKPKDSVK